MVSRANKEHRSRKKKRKWSNAQVRLMAASAHDPEIAARRGIKMSVAQEITEEKAKSGQLSKAMKELHRGN